MLFMKITITIEFIFMQPKYLKNHLFLFKNITNQKYNLVFLKYYVKLYQTLT